MIQKLITRLIILCHAAMFLACAEEKPQPKKPNILLIMADDMGFSDIGSYGGEIHTPNIDALAHEGLQYTQFYNNARCCPTRASLMTGLYPHQAGMGWMTAADLGRPEYQGELNKQSVTLAEVLKPAGYSTYMSGKWHLSRVRNIKAGIKTNWPKQRGFDRFFGIVDGAANYFNPLIFSDNKSYRAPGNDFYLTHAISDSSVRFLDQHFKKNTNPMFMYVAYTAPHWPLHALKKDIEKYKEMYTVGWDELRRKRLQRQKELGIFDSSVVLSSRDTKVPAWEDLPKEKQEDFTQRMAIYAAQVDAMDQGIGRIINKLKELGQYNNTLIFFLSDNGACAEFISKGKEDSKTEAFMGTASSWESYRINWANLSSTPYKEYKHWIHGGGIATPFIVHWPNGIDHAGSMVRGEGHIIDIMATCVDISGATYPTSFRGNDIIPMEGESLKPQFNGGNRDRGPIYWEHEANIGVRDGKWKLVAKTAENEEFDTNSLELYDMLHDPSEMNNLADTYPETRDSLFSNWQRWGERVHVFMDTREYGKRARTYQRQINGQFDNQFAGWQLEGKDQSVFSIDSTSAISGTNAARISVVQGEEARLSWPFYIENGERFKISYKIKAKKKTSLNVSLEPNKGRKIYVQHLQIEDEEIRSMEFKTDVAPKNGMYKLVFNATDNKSGAVLWIDDIELAKY